MFNPVPVGKRTRYSYARIKEVMEMPHLLDIQRNSYQWFLDKGLQEIFHDISPIQGFSGNLVLSFESFSLGEPKYDLDECKERDVTLAAPLRVNVRLINRETGEIKEQEVFMGDFPLMTDTGTFIINGAERVIVSQLVRSPGAYYGEEIDPTGKHLYNATVIPNRGAWIELETDTNDVVSVRIDRTRKMPVTYFIRALGFDTDEKIIELFGTAGGEMTNMTTHQDQTVLSFKIPTRGIMGLRTKILNASHGEAIFSHRFSEYGPMRGELGMRKNGAMVAMHSDKAVAYALDTLQQRGTLYVEPGDECYEGMIVGENAKEGDMDVNVSKTKQLGNQRASSADKAIMLTPPVKFTLEEALEYIADDELVEITPKSIRLRKRTLDKIGRKKERARALGK